MLCWRYKPLRRTRISSIHLIPLSFLGAILIGTAFLMLPVSSASGDPADFLTALFTATTSVCVTGLVVVDTFSYWSSFGHVVILLLIQIGGLGIITTLSMMMLMARQKFSLGDKLLLQDSLNLSSGRDVFVFLRRVFLGTFMVEGAGALIYAIEFIPSYGIGRGLWFSVFHAVSAFCNAGIDIIGNNSLGSYQSHPLVLAATMMLIIMGGLGYVVWFDIASGIRRGWKRGLRADQIVNRFSEHTKLVLTLTSVLITAGALVFLAAEWRNPMTLGNLSFADKILNSVFESVTLRTAGFATFPQEGLSEFSCLAAYFIMFIGGSPVGTAGGVKTVTMFLVLASAASYIRGDKEDMLIKKSISQAIMRKASAVVAVSVLTVMALTAMLLAAENVSLTDGLFEVVSACATVGLSRGLTGSLGTAGRLIIIVAMYLGRIGPISMAIFFTGQNAGDRGLRHAEGNYFVG